MLSSQQKRIAVLIDAENVSYLHMEYVMQKVANYGTACIKRVYANWSESTTAGWKDLILKYAMHPVQVFAYRNGKNAVDMWLTVDGMDLLHSDAVDAIVIVSNDSDYTPLAMKIREAGKDIIVFGTSHASRTLIHVCSDFNFLPSETTQLPHSVLSPSPVPTHPTAPHT